MTDAIRIWYMLWHEMFGIGVCLVILVFATALLGFIDKQMAKRRMKIENERMIQDFREKLDRLKGSGPFAR